MIDELRKARRILLDSNLLVLFLIGSFDPALIGKHKRTRDYTLEDFGLLRAIVASKTSLVTTPNVTAEASNLVSQIGEPARGGVLALLGRLCQSLEERYVESFKVAQSHCFTRLGLTDSVLVDLCQEGLLLLTVDLDLFLEAGRVGGYAVNFNHIRTSAWDQPPEPPSRSRRRR
jgi:hypothetical protein